MAIDHEVPWESISYPSAYFSEIIFPFFTTTTAWVASSENDKSNNLLTFSADTPSSSGDDLIQDWLSGKYVAETDKTAGTHLSKHITKPISLLSDAVGLKVLLSANRPSVADFDLYYKAITEDQLLDNIAWTLAPKQSTIASDENRDIFSEYTYLIGGDNGTLLPFTTFQLKIVMRSSNSSKVPIIRDLRAIALGV